MDLVFSKVKETFYYNRSSSLAVEALEQQLNKRYAAEDCLITPSGMSAISSTLFSLIRAAGQDGVHIVFSDELYTDTTKLLARLDELAPGSRTYTHRINVCDSEGILRLFGEELRDQKCVMFIESCSNPSGKILDWSILPRLAAPTKELHLVVDNTWLSSAIFNPFAVTADKGLASATVVVSLSKYYSGGKAICGAILGSAATLRPIRERHRMMGLHVCPLAAQAVLDQLPTLDQRVAAASACTLKVLSDLYLKTDLRVIHPFFPTHPSNETYQIMTHQKVLYPSVFVIGLKLSKSQALKRMAKNVQLQHKTSFGGEDHRTDPWPTVADGLVHCRVSVGYRDPNHADVLLGIRNLVGVY